MANKNESKGSGLKSNKKIDESSEKNIDIVLQSNQFINAIHSLTVGESRIIEMAIVDARETGTGLSTTKPLRLYVKDYAERFGITWQSAHGVMTSCTQTLIQKSYKYPHPKYPNEPSKNVKSNYLQDFAPIHDEGCFELTFTRSVVDEISRIDGKKMPYTTYFLAQTAKMSSIYAIRLFQLLSTWRKTLADTKELTPLYEIEFFRLQLGVADLDYPRIFDFKKRVLDLGVKQINDVTDMTVEYKQIKKGRTVIGFKFSIKNKKMDYVDVVPDKKEEGGGKFVFGFKSDKQRDFVASLLSTVHAVVGNSSWKTASEASIAISKDLNDSDKQQQYIPYIEKLMETADLKLKKVKL